MKKKLSIILLSVVFVLSSALMLACSKESKNDIFGDYDFTNPPELEKTYDTDPGVVLDGKFDEDFWTDDLVWWEGTSSDGTNSNNPIVAGSFTPCDVRVTSHFTDKGAYFAAEVDETVINVWRENQKLTVYQKTGLTFYIAPFGSTTTAGNAYELIFAADGSSMLRKHYLGGYNNYPLTTVGCGISINGTVDEHGNAERVDGYTMEVFIPWAVLDMEEKPEYLYSFMASIRHQNAGDKSQFAWENITPGADWSKPNTWPVFTADGLFAASAPLDYTIDGDGADWAGYSGKVKRVESSVDSRYLEYKMTRGQDGLYIYAEALQRLWLTGSNNWYRNTNIELSITSKSGGSVQYYLTPDQISANTTGIIKYVDKKADDTDYKFITAELFISDETLYLAGVDVDKEELRVAMGFRNGKYQPAMGDDKAEFTLENNEVITPVTIGANKDQPFIWYALGCNPYGGASNRMYVTEDGITGISANDKVIDGDDADWADYIGVEAAAYGRINVANGAADRSAEGKGFKVIAEKGSDGVYIYATVRHAQWKTTDLESHMNSNLAVGFALTNTSYTGDNDTLEWLRGNEIFFTSVGSNYGENVNYVINRSDEKDDKGLYTTVIEGFIPYGQLFSSLTTTDTSKTNKPGQWADIFDPVTGEIADGYALRAGFQWRTREETASMQARAANRNDWMTAILPSVPSRDSAWKMYYLDDAGLHLSRITGKYYRQIDWDGYSAEVSRIEGSGASEGLWTESKAVLKDDGLYARTTAKMKHYSTSVAPDGDWWKHWYKSTNVEYRAVNAQNKNIQFGYVNPWVASNTGDIFDIDFVFDVQYDGTYYNITIDTYFNNNWIKSKLGVSSVPESIKLGFSFGVNYSGDIAGVPQTDYVDFVNGSNGNSLWNGNIWGDNTVTVSQNGLYYVSAAGMTLEFEEGKTYISSEDVTDNAPAAGYEFTGSAITPEVTVKAGGATLEKDTDYTLTFSANTAAGTASYTVKGKGDYFGTVTKTFKINAVSADKVTVDAVADQEYAGGGQIIPALTVKLGGYSLKEGTDYTVTAAENKAVGAGSLTLNFKGNFSGEKTVTFKIVPKNISSGVEASVTSVVVGTKPTEITVKFGDVTLVENKDFIVAYEGYDAVGQGTATVTGMGNYTGTLEVKFTVSEPVDISDNAGVTAEAVAKQYYNPDAEEFLPEEVTVSYDNGSETVTLVLGSDYDYGSIEYDNTDGGTASLTIIGKGAFQGERVVTYTVNHFRYFSGKNSDNLSVVVSGEPVYDGTEKTVEVTVKWGEEALNEGSDYVVSYANNVNAGKAEITVTAAGDRYRSAYDTTFTISPADIAEVAEVTVPDDLKFTGVEVYATPTVTVDGVALVADRDYGYTSNGDNINLKSDKGEDGQYLYNYGEADCRVYGLGNYTGNVEVPFKFYNPSSEKRLDGDFADWKDYEGNTAITYDLGNTEGYEIKAWWGEEGMYFAAVIRHNVLNNDAANNMWVNSALCVENAIVSADKSVVVKGRSYFFAYTGMNYDGMHRAHVVQEGNGDYVSYIEAFIPKSLLIQPEFAEYFDEQGNLIDGYDMRLGVAFQNKDDNAFLFENGLQSEDNSKSNNYWQPIGRKSYYEEKIAKNEFLYIDKPNAEVNRGLRFISTVAADRAIDGDISDWADYDAAAESGAVLVNTIEIGDGRYGKYRAYYGDDGLYLSFEGLVNNVIVGNYQTDGLWQQDIMGIWYKSFSMELHIKTSASDTTHDNVYHTVYGFNSTFISEGAGNARRKTYNGEKNIMESCMSYTQQSGGKYLVVIEAFIPNKDLYGISGQEGVNPWVYNWIVGTNNSNENDYYNSMEEFVFVEGGSGEVGNNASGWGKQWIGGAYKGDMIKTWSATAA